MSIDEKDARILLALANQQTTSPEMITGATGIPKSTVHYRIERLRKQGVLTSKVFDVDREQLGLSMTVISEVSAEYEEGYHEEVGERISKLTGVNQVYFVMGDTDFIVISHLSSHEDVQDLITQYERIDNIQRTSSKFVIDTVKSSSSPLLDYDQESLFDALSIKSDRSSQDD